MVGHQCRRRKSPGNGERHVARSASGKRFGISLGTWIFLIIGLLVLLTAGGALVATRVLGGRFAQQSAAGALDSSRAVRTVLQQQRYRQLQLISRIFATDRVLTSYLAEPAETRDPVSILDSLEEYQNLLSFDLAVVLDQDGTVLTRTDDPQAFGEDLADNPIVAVALEEKQAFGIWQQGEGLYHAVALPLVRNFEQVGYVVVAFSINDALARQIQRISGADMVFLTNGPTGPTVAASTLAPAAAAELISSLRLKGEILGRVTQQGETADQVDVQLEGQDWTAFLAPLEDASETAVGAAVALTSFEERLADHRLLQLLLIGLGAAALIAGLLFSQLLSRRTLKPLGLLATAAGRAGHGDFDAPLPAGGPGDVGRLRDSLDGLFGDLGGRQALEYFAARVHRYLPEPAKGSALARPRAGQVVLLAVEMRRFANPKIGYDPEESLGRLGRDLQRFCAAVNARKGRVEAVFGHRALAVFEGDGATFQALCAATETLQVLSERENVFDEAEPPVVALANGAVVLGSVAWGDQPSPATAGLPVQQLESLLREATPGGIYFSKTVGQELAELLKRSGIQVRAQRGLLSPQPLYVLSAEQASQMTGVTPAEPAATGYPEERRDLSIVRAGSVLGNRYDVMAELGVGRMGPILKAQDRELGDLVTLKMLKPEITADAARFERLKGVIQQARMLRHPNVLGVLDFAETEGMPYISVEFARALTLRYLLDQGGRMGVTAGLYLARQIGWGLAAAHQENVLHLGLKPENILVEPQGHARVMDFGLSMALGAGVPVSGAPYLAPEQLEGGGDARSDVYALGAVLYEALAGQTPYVGSTPEAIRQQHLMQDAAPLSTLAEEIPPQLDQIVARCLAKAPDARYASIEEMLADLGSLRAAES